jgi:multiple antibiotic resistance protein
MHNRNDIALTPLAIPMLAGPGSIITNRILSRTQHDNGNYYFLDCDSCHCSCHFYHSKSAHYLAKILGASGIIAISRIVGFIVIAIGIQYIVSAIINIIKGISRYRNKKRRI